MKSMLNLSSAFYSPPSLAFLLVEIMIDCRREMRDSFVHEILRQYMCAGLNVNDLGCFSFKKLKTFFEGKIMFVRTEVQIIYIEVFFFLFPTRAFRQPSNEILLILLNDLLIQLLNHFYL